MVKKLSVIAGLSTLFIFLAFLAFQIAVLIFVQREVPAPIFPGQVPLMTATSGTKAIAVADNPTVEFDIYEDASTTNRTAGEFTVDLSNFDTVHTTGDTITVRVYEQVAGTTYRQLDNAVYTDNSITNHVLVKNFMTNRKVKYTAQTSADRGAFDLYFAYRYRNEN